MRKVLIIDTSILCVWLKVPGMNSCGHADDSWDRARVQKKIQKEEKEKFSLLHIPQDSNTHHYNQRSMVERVNKYLKDDFGCDKIYYQGATKIALIGDDELNNGTIWTKEFTTKDEKSISLEEF